MDTLGARHLLQLERLSFPLPVINVLHDHLGSGLGGILATDTFNEVVVRV